MKLKLKKPASPKPDFELLTSNITDVKSRGYDHSNGKIFERFIFTIKPNPALDTRLSGRYRGFIPQGTALCIKGGIDDIETAAKMFIAGHISKI